MFGQQSSPFGSPSPAPAFGGGGFGSAPFGSPSPAPFGSPSPAPAFGFGGGSTAFGGGGGTGFGGGGSTAFGSSSPATAFGAQSSTFGAPASSGFGQPSAFGQQPAAAPAFGQPSSGFGQNSTPAFGSSTTSTPFGGSTAPAPSAFGGFGSNTANTSSPFGATSTSAFGATPAPSTGIFGSQPAPAPGLFGAPSPAPTAFGAPAPPPAFGGFGAPTPAAVGAFGAPAAGMVGQPGGGGTKVAPFTPTNKQDGTSTITMNSISAMTQYENKSFEELRFEDYSQGNKGSANAAASTGFGGFGAAPAPGTAFGSPSAPPSFGTPSPGLFGSSPAPAPFGSPAPAPFGAPTSFGAPSPAPFGSSAPAPFGSPAPAPFGGAAAAPFGTPAPSTGFGSSFGKPAGGSLFGAPAPGAGTSLFGGNPAPAPFGTPSPAPGVFGAPAPSTGIFGAPATAPGSSLFGSTPAPAPFGAPAPPPAFGAFGTPAPAPGGAFGSSTPAFGAPSTGIFGAPSPGTSLFGATAPAPPTGAFGAQPGGGFFGSPAPAPGASIFGQTAASPAVPVLPPAGSIIPQAASEVLTHQIQALENKRQEMEKLDVWKSSSANETSIVPASRPEYDAGMSSLVTYNSQYSPYRPSPRSMTKIRPRGFGSVLSPPVKANTSPLNEIGNSGRPMMSPDAYAASSVKRLVIKPESMTPKPRMRLRLHNTPADNNTKNQASLVSQAGGTPAAATQDAGTNGASHSQSPAATPGSIPVFGRDQPAKASSPVSPRINMNGMHGGKTFAALEKIPHPVDPGLEYYQKVIGSPDTGTPAPVQTPRSNNESVQSKKRPSYLPKLSKPGYVVTPSLDELALKSEADLATLSGFSVRHDPFGLIEWEGEVDVRNADLDLSVAIGQNDISMYTIDEERGQKPPIGSKLNRPAIVTFFNVFPRNGGADADEETKLKFAKKIEKSTNKMGADLLSYDKDTGEWKIRIKHF